MPVWKAIAIATAAEFSFAGAALGLASLGGSSNGWLDVVAQFAPLCCALAAMGALLALGAMGRGYSRRAILALAAVGIITSGSLFAPEFVRALAQGMSLPAKAAAPVKVLTFNVWDSDSAPMKTVDLVIAANPDMLAIQEVYGIRGAGLQRLNAAGYRYSGGWENDCNLELLSKHPLTNLQIQRFVIDEQPLCVISAWTAAPDGRAVQIVTTHFAWPAPPERQKIGRLRLAALVRQFHNPELILMGDFNLNPWSHALRAQDAALKPLERRTRGVFTWPAIIAVLQAASPFPFMAIDHLYAGPGWRTVDVRRLPRGGSDHYGVLVTLERKP